MGEKIVNNGVHEYTEQELYQYPSDPAVLEHLKWFQGLKLGFMLHWSPGSQLGTYESWPLSDGDADWSRRDVDWTGAEEFKEQYWNANRTFNPVKFCPDRWASLAAECGFQYLLFTTKHHDGFCMFDTETTDYKITHPSCPFHTSPYADITRSLFDAFRRQGMAVSVYFSKPDWHNDNYWHREFGNAATRNINYRREDHPELWENFAAFTHRQLEELGTQYGKIDVLWLDGGWVRPDNEGQDIRLGQIVEKLRKTSQPHLIVCDRTVGGEFENIVTPEKTIPEQVLPIPWETCITLGDYFSFHYTDHYKTGRELVHILLDVVSKGGNLALNLTPQPDGELPKPAVHSIRQLGSWLHIFGDGIYETRIQEPYFSENLKYTGKPGITYAFFLYDDIPALPAKLQLTSKNVISRVVSMRTKQSLPFEQDGSRIIVDTNGLTKIGAEDAEGFSLEMLL